MFERNLVDNYLIEFGNLAAHLYMYKKPVSPPVCVRPMLFKDRLFPCQNFRYVSDVVQPELHIDRNWGIRPHLVGRTVRGDHHLLQTTWEEVLHRQLLMCTDFFSLFICTDYFSVSHRQFLMCTDVFSLFTQAVFNVYGYFYIICHIHRQFERSF